MDFVKLKNYLEVRKQPAYRFTQIASDVTSGRSNSFQDIFTIPQSLRDDLIKEIPFMAVKEHTVLASNDKKAYKALLELSDGTSIETVLLNPKPALWSVCLSCQVGCPMNCSFCATGKMGFIRNLTTEEITDQLLFWKQYITKQKLPIHISNLIYMGMGEPFLNREAVFESFAWINQYFGIGQRHLSVSTSGIIPGIEALATAYPQVNLAVSLHSPLNALRDTLMPVNKTYPLEKLFDAIESYLKTTNRQLFIEYILLSGINDSDKHAVALGNLLSDRFSKQKHLLHINLIIYNPVDGMFHSGEKKQTEKFERIISQFGLSVSIRKSLGQDIAGACGQLKAAL